MRSAAFLAFALFVSSPCVFGAEGDPAKPAKAAAAARTLTPVETELTEAQSNFVAAFNKGDAKLVLAFFTPDADWIDDQGAIMRGHAAIQRALKDSISGHEGRTLTLRLDSVRTLGPDVVVGNATSTFVASDKSTETAAFIAVWVKQDGKWLISVLTETSEVEDEE